jgi:hypothetical protein
MKILTQILFIGASIFAFVWYINPTYTNVQKKQESFAKLEDAYGKAVILRTKREQLMADKKKITAGQLKNLNEFLPDGVENVRLIIDIENIASQVLHQDVKSARVVSGSTGNKTAPTSGGAAGIGPDGKKYGTITLSFSVTTTYDQFIVLLKNLEDNLRLVDVTGVTFSANDTGTYDFSVTLQTYWLR